jgi:phosphate:Na+ symporter
VEHGGAEDLRALERLDDEVDVLHGAVVSYLGEMAQEHLDHDQAEQHFDYLEAANNIENIGDLVETNLVGIGLERLNLGVRVSDATRDRLEALHERVCWTVQLAFQALDASDAGMAREVIAAKPEIRRLAEAAEAHLAHRLTVEAPDRLALYRFESELIEYLKRVYYFAKRIAKAVESRSIDPPTDGTAVPALPTLEPSLR